MKDLIIVENKSPYRTERPLQRGFSDEIKLNLRVNPVEAGRLIKRYRK